MNPALASRLSRLALGCVTREFPYNPGHVLHGARDLRRPRALHPAFYGCFDWHSAVHGHWLLAHLVRRFPRLPQGDSIRHVLRTHLSTPNLKKEAAYLLDHPGFERPYGWAWALKLACEVPLAPLAAAIETLYLDWLPKQTYPIRSGTHTNTAFGLAFALDYARRFHRVKLERLLVKKALAFYGRDMNYPAQWEPGGNDFFSPALIEADLMRRVAPDFARWLARFLPAMPASLRKPAKVSDRSDGQLAHLDGLNLSRAWCFYALGKKKLGDLHFRAGIKHVASGSYAGEHWLASFAAYAAACALDGATSTPASRSRAAWRE